MDGDKDVKKDEDKDVKKDKDIDILVLSGGGLRGCIHIGLLRYLEEAQMIDKFKVLAGTSIGALIAALYNLGYKSSELTGIVSHFSYDQYQSIDINHLFENFGFDNYDKITQFIESLFKAKNYDPKVTFEQLHQRTSIHLIINAVCLNTQNNVYFDYVSYPEMPVVLGIKASMSLPYIFGCIKYRGLTYVDGGLLDNFITNHPLMLSQPGRVLGVNLGNTINQSIKDISSITQYSLTIISCIYQAYNQLSWQLRPHHDMNIIHIRAPKFNTFNLHMSLQDKLYLIELGYQQSRDYFMVKAETKSEARAETKSEA